MRDASTNPHVAEFLIEEASPRPATKVLIVHGDADLHTAPELRERLRDAIEDGATTIVVDLSAATIIDSTWLGVLLRGIKQLGEQDGQIRLVVPRAEVRRIFEVTMLDRVFPLYESLAEALAEVPEKTG